MVRRGGEHQSLGILGGRLRNPGELALRASIILCSS